MVSEEMGDGWKEQEPSICDDYGRFRVIEIRITISTSTRGLQGSIMFVQYPTYEEKESEVRIYYIPRYFIPQPNFSYVVTFSANKCKSAVHPLWYLV